jgi:co-chaperonin GroES (HSP10)
MALTSIKGNFTPIGDKVLVSNLEHGDTVTKAGIIITDDNLTNRGIRSRWGKVWAIGPKVKDIAVGQWILIEHGRWTQKIKIETAEENVDVWSVEYPKSVLAVSDEKPDSTATSIPGLEFQTRKR